MCRSSNLLIFIGGMKQLLANCKGFWGPYHQLNHSGIMDDSMLLLSIFGSLRSKNDIIIEREKIFQIFIATIYWLCVTWCESQKSCRQMLTGYVLCIVKHYINFSDIFISMAFGQCKNVNKMFYDDWHNRQTIGKCEFYREIIWHQTYPRNFVICHIYIAKKWKTKRRREKKLTKMPLKWNRKSDETNKCKQ